MGRKVFAEIQRELTDHIDPLLVLDHQRMKKCPSCIVGENAVFSGFDGFILLIPAFAGEFRHSDYGFPLRQPFDDCEMNLFGTILRFQLGMGKDRTDGVMPELFDIVVVGDIECESPRCSGLEDYTAHGRIFVGQKLCILIAPRRIDLEAETPAQALILSECERMSAVIAHRDPQVNRLILKVVQL